MVNDLTSDRSESDPAAVNGPDVWAGRRADARRNHERVLVAAIEVFTEHGLDATIPQVAARAGVGKATVYRSYPTKADLVDALAQVHREWLASLVEEAALAADRDAFRALERFLHDLVRRLAEDRLMVDVLGVVDAGTLQGDRAGKALEYVLDCGRSQGVLREDVTRMDIQVLVSGFARALLALDVRDVATWRRYVALTLAALRPEAPPGRRAE